MKPMYRKRIKNAAFIWTGFGVLVLLAYVAILAPQARTKKQIDKLLVEKKQTYHAAVTASGEENRIQLKEQIEQMQNTMKNFVIDYRESTNLTLDISQIANDRKVSDFSISGRGARRSRTVEIPNCKHIRENRIGIGFDAGFNNFATFLNTLERHKPVVFVDTFRISRFDVGEADAVNKVKMDLSVFIRKRLDDSTDAI